MGTVFSSIHRLALVIGNNIGLDTEHPLKYAARDARMMAALLSENGGFKSERVYLQLNQSTDRIKFAFKEIIGRVKEIVLRNEKAMFLLYYSGHGSRAALHLNGEMLPRDTLRHYLHSLSAHLKVGIIDACESGHLLRQKGGKIVKRYEIEKVDELKNKGIIMISSSSKGELAQESELYKGAVFTHHLINGMKGGADYNNDFSVSMWEAFHYANVSTKRENILGKIGQQNPNFDFDIVGESDFVLTKVHPSHSRIIFNKIPGSVVEIRDAANMQLEARIILHGRDSVYFQCPSKRYLISYEKGNRFFVRELDMTWKKEMIVSPKLFKRLSKAEVISKGGGFRLNPHSMRYGFQSISIGFGAKIPFIMAAYCHRGYLFKHSLSFGYGRNKQNEQWMDIHKQAFALAWSSKYPFLEYKLGQLSGGVELGWYGVRQKIIDKRFGQTDNPYDDKVNQANIRFSNVYETTLSFEYEVFLIKGFILSISEIWGLQYYLKAGRSNRSFTSRPQVAIEYRF